MTSKANVSLRPIVLKVELGDFDQAWQLAQFIKRVGIDEVLAQTEGHLPSDDRLHRAHLMMNGLDSVARALREVGIAPR